MRDTDWRLRHLLEQENLGPCRLRVRGVQLDCGGRRPRVRVSHRRIRPVLGQQPQRTTGCARRAIHCNNRGSPVLVRAEAGRHDRLLGRRRVAGPDSDPGGHFASASGTQYSCGLRVKWFRGLLGGRRCQPVPTPGGRFTTLDMGDGRTCPDDGAAVCWGPRGQTYGSDRSCAGRDLLTRAGCASAAPSPAGATTVPDPGTRRPLQSHNGRRRLHLRTPHHRWSHLLGRQRERPDPGTQRLSAIDAGPTFTCGLRVGAGGHGPRNGSNPQRRGCSGQQPCSGAAVPDGQGVSRRARHHSSADTCLRLGRARSRCSGAASAAWPCAPDAGAVLVEAPTEGVRDLTHSPPGDAGRAGPFTAVSAGAGHACGLLADSSVACWGNNVSGQAGTPEGPFIALSGGVNQTCGIRIHGTISCWGRAERPYWMDQHLLQQTLPPGRFSAVSAGHQHACGLRADETVACWGKNQYGQLDVSDERFVALDAGRITPVRCAPEGPSTAGAGTGQASRRHPPERSQASARR